MHIHQSGFFFDNILNDFYLTIRCLITNKPIVTAYSTAISHLVCFWQTILEHKLIYNNGLYKNNYFFQWAIFHLLIFWWIKPLTFSVNSIHKRNLKTSFPNLIPFFSARIHILQVNTHSFTLIHSFSQHF